MKLLAKLAFLSLFLAPLRAENILPISIDTLRADRLSCYGYRGIQTPSMDRLGPVMEASELAALGYVPIASSRARAAYTGVEIHVRMRVACRSLRILIFVTGRSSHAQGGSEPAQAVQGRSSSAPGSELSVLMFLTG